MAAPDSWSVDMASEADRKTIPAKNQALGARVLLSSLILETDNPFDRDIVRHRLNGQLLDSKHIGHVGLLTCLTLLYILRYKRHVQIVLLLQVHYCIGILKPFAHYLPTSFSDPVATWRPALKSTQSTTQFLNTCGL